MVEIPIRNIYYLLCYAWNKLEERDLVNVDAEAFKDLPNLFAKVLANGLSHLFKKGLDRNYIAEDHEYPGIKGKLLLSETLKRSSIIKGRTHCSFDEFSHDVLHNQLLKATLVRLLHYDGLSKKVREEISVMHQRFHNVSDIKLNRRFFFQVTLHRNNSFYKFLLNICLLIHDNLLFDQSKGTWNFRDFIRDEDQMAALFEKFILNFYKRELSKEWNVSVEIIKWQAVALSGSSLDYLPRMKTDISLTSRSRKIIIDAKYYKEAMVRHYDSDKFRAGHVYQMNAYMTNVDTSGCEGKSIEGILIYPTVETSFNQSFKLPNGYLLGFQTLDLRDDWQAIEMSLLRAIKSTITEELKRFI